MRFFDLVFLRGAGYPGNHCYRGQARLALCRQPLSTPETREPQHSAVLQAKFIIWATLWEILVNFQNSRSSYFLNQASKLAGKICRDMEIFSISLKKFPASLEAWFKK